VEVERLIIRDYAERVYAGVLGKVIGVYLGRPFEGWTYERIMDELGEINYYVHDRLGKELIVTDDDISGTFTFLRALEDYGCTKDITPEQIGQTWLNYLIEDRTILWWGGMGNSTEHTAYFRLKEGIPAPRSGSMELNGQVVAEQIGAQIFVDGWGMVCPGDPELAAEFARRAGSVSHDGEAIYGAQVIAAMAAQAFVESDLNKLLDTAVALIPRDSIIYRMIADIRSWREKYPDWRVARQKLEDHYGYDKYGGNCHMIPNHGLIILSLLYGDDNFQKSLMIVNTAGWDTDCNSANVGCLLGIKNGLAGIEDGPDYRTPVADRLYMPTADGGRAISDAVTEAYYVINMGRRLAGLDPVYPKNGARFHFEFPGAVQGFRVDNTQSAGGNLRIENVSGHSQAGKHSLALRYDHVSPGCPVCARTSTFIPIDLGDMGHYELLASPSIYPGQTLQARVEADSNNAQSITCQLYISIYNGNDQLSRVYGPSIELEPAEEHVFSWAIPDQGGQPIAEVGFELSSTKRNDGTVYIDYLTWQGMPTVSLGRPADGGTMWQKAWVNGVDYIFHDPETYRLVQNQGVGLIIQGTREWNDYRVETTIKPHMAKTAGIAARVQGMKRYYALLLADKNKVRLVKCLDGIKVLDEAEMAWELDHEYQLSLQVTSDKIEAWIDGKQIFAATDPDNVLTGGAVAMVVEEGRAAFGAVEVTPTK
jgi:ADP-ribosylglycohydrolase